MPSGGRKPCGRPRPSPVIRKATNEDGDLAHLQKKKREKKKNANPTVFNDNQEQTKKTKHERKKKKETVRPNFETQI